MTVLVCRALNQRSGKTKGSKLLNSDWPKGAGYSDQKAARMVFWERCKLTALFMRSAPLA